MRYFWIFLACCCFGEPLSTEAPILKHVETQLPCFGVLKRSDSFVYLDISDGYIHKLISYIENEGFVKPPYFAKVGSVGAHITVISAMESKRWGIERVEEVGEIIHFTPKECQIVYPPRWGGRDSAYILLVEAPEFHEIREKYGLPKAKFDFHITIGVKYENESEETIHF